MTCGTVTSSVGESVARACTSIRGPGAAHQGTRREAAANALRHLTNTSCWLRKKQPTQQHNNNKHRTTTHNNTPEMSIHRDTTRSVCHFHNSAASTKPPPQLLGSGQCAPRSFGVESLPRRVHSIEAWLQRGAAMMPPTASQRRPAMISRWLRLEN